MKSRRRGGFFGSKDARQSPEGRTEEAGGPDHYALATAAKNRNQLLAVVRAAEEAASRAPATLTTWVAIDEPPVRVEPSANDEDATLAGFLSEINSLEMANAEETSTRQQEGEGISEAASKGGAISVEAGSGTVVQESITRDAEAAVGDKDTGSNALASLLGYSHDDSDGDPSSPRAATEPTTGPSHAAVGAAAEQQGAEAATGKRGDEDLDDAYSRLMGELESDGLLKDDSNPSSSAEGAQEAAADSRKESEGAETSISGAGAFIGPQPMDESAGKVEDDSPAPDGDAAGEPAEQRVLGVLEGAPEWSEVMDMVSSQVYFWNSTTNEVAWEPPDGSNPRSKQETQAIFDKASGGGESKGADAPTTSPASIDDDAVGVAAETEGADLAAWGDRLLRMLQEASSAVGVQAMHPIQRLACQTEVRIEDWRAVQDSSTPSIQCHFRRCFEQIEAEAFAAMDAARQLPSPRPSPEASPTQAAVAMETSFPADSPVSSSDPSGPPAHPTPPDPSSSQGAAAAAPGEREEGELSDPEGTGEIGAGTPSSQLDPTVSGATSSNEEPELPPLPLDDDRFPNDRDPPPGESLPPLPDDNPPGSPTPPLPEDPYCAETPQLPPAAELMAASLAGGVGIAGAESSTSLAGERRREYTSQPVPAELDLSEILESPSGQNPGAELDGSLKRKRVPAETSARSSKKKKASSKVPKTASSLINKWAAVRKDLESEGEEEEVLDAGELERKKLREALEWRRTAKPIPDDNPNFQPIVGDWRAKVKAAKKARKAEKATTDGQPDLQEASRGLPPGWQAIWDTASKKVYYGNLVTKESSWARPA